MFRVWNLGVWADGAHAAHPSAVFHPPKPIRHQPGWVFGVWGLRFGVLGFGVWVWSVGFGVWGWGLEFKAQGLP